MSASRCTIPYTEIETVMRMLNVRDATDCFLRVRQMLSAARNVFVTRHNEEAARSGRG